MEVTTSCGTLFVIPSVEEEKLKELSPCKFLALLLTENRGLSWATFNRENIAEVIAGAVKGFHPLARNLSRPFDFDKCVVQFSKDWKHIERVLQYPLPALPTPTIVKVPRDVHSLVYQQAGRSYRLPQANGFIFTSEGLDFNHFLKIWIYLNKRNMETIIVKEVQAALRSFAHQGFPDAHKLTKRLLKLFDSSDERKMMQQHWAKVWLDLKVNRPNEKFSVAALKTQAYSMDPAAASSELPGQLGSVTSTVPRNRTPMTYTMSKLQLELLRSENRFLTITVYVPKPRNRAAFVKAELEAISDVQRRSGPGLLGAIWYGRELIVEFAACAQRDRALRTLTRGSSTLVKENIQPIGSGEGGGARLYMSWLLPFYREDTPATLSSALEDHFDQTGYSSFFTFGQFDRPEGNIRIIFHNVPPVLKSVLKSHCFQERWFVRDAVNKTDYPLQKPSSMQKEIKANADAAVAEELANDIDNESTGSAVENPDKEAISPLQIEQEHNESESTVPSTIRAKTDVSADVDAAEGPANDTGKRVEVASAEDPDIEIQITYHFEGKSSGDNNTVFDEQTQISESEVADDHRVVNETTTAVLVDEKSYNIPTASALPLHEATFNTFTRMYLESRRDELEKMDRKTLIKLYRTFLEVQFPHVEGEARMNAFQRLNFNEPVIDPRSGGLSYPFTMAARNVYHKELFELSEASRNQATPTTSNTNATDNESIAHQAINPSADNRSVHPTTPEGADSQRKRALSSKIPNPTSNSPSPSSSFTSLEPAPSAPTHQKPPAPDMLSALERYLDDLDAGLQLERELLQACASPRAETEERDAG